MTKPPLYQWSITADLRPLVGGSRGRVFRTVGLPQDLVFKTTDRSAEALAWLTPVHAAAEAAGLAVPKLIESRNNALAEDGWTAEPFLDGTPLADSDPADLAAKIGNFHALARDIPQRPGFLSSHDLQSADTGGDVDLSLMPAALVASCRAAWARLETLPQTIIHADLNPGNLLRLADGRFAILDWDEARRDSPAFDLAQLTDSSHAEKRACLAWEIACCWTKEPERARALAELL